MEGDSMMKYQKPEMVIVELMSPDVITTSVGGTLYPSTDTDENGSSVGGGAGAGFDNF